MFLVRLLVIASLFVAAGCANQAATDYYTAVQETAAANASAQAARYQALASVAASGSDEAAVAATMAIALTQNTVVTPQYIEDPALSWTRVLAGPVAAVAGLAIQADVAKNASDNAKDIQLASFATNEAIQLGQQDMVAGLGQQYAATTAANNAALVELGVVGLEAINVAGQQTVDVGNNGIAAVTDLSTVNNAALLDVTMTNAQTVDGLTGTINNLVNNPLTNTVTTETTMTQVVQCVQNTQTGLVDCAVQ